MDTIAFFFELDGTIIQLPINPEKLGIKYKGNNAVKEIVSLGDINLLKRGKLGELSIECWFPYDTWFPTIQTRGKFKKPDYYCKFFLKLLKNSRSCKLIITGLKPEISMEVSVENFEYEHRAGEHEDIYYTLDLKEYRPYSVKEVDVIEALKRIEGKSTSSTKKSKKDTPAKTLTATKITIGCSVTLNGTVCYDSYGSRPGKTFKNYKGKISLINKKGTHPYHVTTMAGGWLGWVLKGDVKIR